MDRIEGPTLQDVHGLRISLHRTARKSALLSRFLRTLCPAGFCRRRPRLHSARLGDLPVHLPRLDSPRCDSSLDGGACLGSGLQCVIGLLLRGRATVRLTIAEHRVHLGEPHDGIMLIAPVERTSELSVNRIEGLRRRPFERRQTTRAGQQLSIIAQRIDARRVPGCLPVDFGVGKENVADQESNAARRPRPRFRYPGPSGSGAPQNGPWQCRRRPVSPIRG